MEDKVRGIMEQLQKEHEKKREMITEVAGKSDKLGQSIQEYSRQKLENEMVLKELELLSSDSVVMKQIGPCLIKQDMFEATGNVKKRIEYISDELSRLEKQKESLDKEHRELNAALGKVQDKVRTVMNEMQAASGPAVA
jgi:prefoldin beta subunit